MIIKHERNLDVCAEVIKINPWQIKLNWINMGFTKSYYIGVAKWYRRERFDDHWLKCETPNVMCLRDATWKPIKL